MERKLLDLTKVEEFLKESGHPDTDAWVVGLHCHRAPKEGNYDPQVYNYGCGEFDLDINDFLVEE